MGHFRKCHRDDRLEQLVDDTHDAFLVDTGGELGTLLVTAELDEETPTEVCRATIQFTVWDPSPGFDADR